MAHTKSWVAKLWERDEIKILLTVLFCSLAFVIYLVVHSIYYAPQVEFKTPDGMIEKVHMDDTQLFTTGDTVTAIKTTRKKRYKSMEITWIVIPRDIKHPPSPGDCRITMDNDERCVEEFHAVVTEVIY